MNLEKKFSELKRRREGGLIAFITAGDPSPQHTVEIANALISAGVDILELGLPFSDPIADGIAIQKASERSLKKGMDPDLYFSIAKKIKGVPKVCLTYYNLVLQRGLEKFTQDCKNSGISGLIVPDLPIEESAPLLKACRNSKVELIFLVAQTTTEKRLKEILKSARGFLYVVSLLGVTGVRKTLSKEVAPTLKKVKAHSRIPLAVGFGISKPQHVKEVLGSGADAAIVGSAFVRIIEKNLGKKKKMLKELETFARKLKTATRK